MNATDPNAPIMELSKATINSLQAPALIVIDNVNWQVRPGEYWVVGGPPGSGKTDLLATGAGLLRPSRGTHRLFGQEISYLKEDERVQLQVRVGIVFGGGGRLFSHLTVAENLSLPWCYHRNCAPEAVQERLDAILDATGLASFQNNTPATIDRTLRLRTALARALMLSPEILFLDNPLAGTGPRELHWWLEFLDKLRSGHPILGNQSLTVVVSTASLEHWSERGDRFGLVQGRQFIPLGSRVELARQSERVLQELLPSGKLGE